MNEQELRKRLDRLKSAPVPKGYWENYWPKMRTKIARAQGRMGAREQTERISLVPRFLFPTFAALCFGIVCYWMGANQAVAPLRPSASSPLLLTSNSSAPEAERVFKEMLQLFPNRVNWISFVDGKVDFSISSVAYDKKETLIPLVLTLRKSKEDFEARLLIRAGQEASIHSAWDKNTTIDSSFQLHPTGQEVHVQCRLSNAKDHASVEGPALLEEGQKIMLGAVCWEQQLVQLQLMRPDAVKASTKKIKHETSDKIQL